MSELPDLSDMEIDVICDGYTQSAAKCRYLRSLGLTVVRKPNGRPLVSRSHYQAVRNPVQQAFAPARAGGGIKWGISK